MSHDEPKPEQLPTADYLPTDPAVLDSVTQTGAQEPGTVSQPGQPKTVSQPKPPRELANVPEIEGYILEAEIARGGMGVVYRAIQARLNRPVAIKLMLNAEGTGLIRFLAEAEAIAAVRHPNVLQVYDSGQAHGLPYIAMEYCPGGTLSDKLKTVPKYAPREAAELLARIAEGVGMAHTAGIIHRDLKPANVLFDAQGVPKVADFGLAKRATGADLTITQAIMGTPAYMSPEQASGGTRFVGPTADVWALGVILYECLSGTRPFQADDVDGVLNQVRSANPLSLRLQSRQIPRELDLIVRKCLTKEPTERYATANELAEDLRNWLAGKPIQAKPTGAIAATWKWAKRNPTVAVSLTVALAAMIAGTVISIWQARIATFQKGQALSKAHELSMALQQKTEAEQKLQTELKESRRLIDLSRLREAELDFDRNAVQSARDKLAAIAPENRCIAWGLLRRRVEGSDLTLVGHTGWVTSVAFSPDGKRIVTGSWDMTARIWDAAIGQTVIELKGHTGGITSVAFSPDAKRIVTGSWDKSARVWDSATGQILLELKGHSGGVTSVAISPNGKRVVTGSDDKVARVWDIMTGQMIVERKHSGTVGCVQFSPNSQRIVSGWDDMATVWDAHTGQLTCQLIGHATSVTSASFTPDGGRVVTGGRDRTTRVWDATSGKELFIAKWHTDGVTSVAVSPEGRRIVSSTHTGQVMVWSTNSGESLLELNGHTNGASSVAFSPDGLRIATASWDGTVRIWDATTGQSRIVIGQSQHELAALAQQLNCVDFHPDGRRVVTGSKDKTIRIWDSATGQTLSEFNGHNKYWVSCVAFSPDGRRVASGSSGESIARVWDVVTAQPIFELKGHSAFIKSLSYSKSGLLIATGSFDRSARVWDAATGQSLHELKGHTGMVQCLAFSPDSRKLVTGSIDGTARIWDATTGQSLLELKGHVGWVTSVGFSPDGDRVTTGGQDKTIRLWDTATGQEQLILSGHTGMVSKSEFSSDGLRVITGSDDGVCRIWDAATGQSLIALEGQEGRIVDVAVSPEDSRIVTVSDDGIGRMWDTERRERRPGDPPNQEELVRRVNLARPQPERHAKIAEEYRSDPFAWAVQKSLEQRARGLMAFDDLEWSNARWHLLAAELLKPKTDLGFEVAPLPRSRK